MNQRIRTNLGRYLFSTRINAGYDSIGNYLRDKRIPLSESYYRDLESGKKVIRLETAKQLCDAIGAPKVDFFAQLLRDVLPGDVYRSLVRPTIDNSFENVAERQKLLEHDIQVYGEALAHERYRDSWVPSADCIDFLNDNPELLPLIHYIYMMPRTTRTQLQTICDQNHIQRPLDSVIEAFLRFAIIGTEPSDDDSHETIVSRRSHIFRVPSTPAGQALKDRFVLEETRTSLAKPRLDLPFNDSGTFVESRIEAVPRVRHDSITKRVLDLVAEISAASEPSQSSDATPCFISIIFSQRPEYRVDADGNPSHSPSAQSQPAPSHDEGHRI